VFYNDDKIYGEEKWHSFDEGDNGAEEFARNMLIEESETEKLQLQ
jgi:hypothetical protein